MSSIISTGLVVSAGDNILLPAQDAYHLTLRTATVSSNWRADAEFTVPFNGTYRLKCAYKPLTTMGVDHKSRFLKNGVYVTGTENIHARGSETANTADIDCVAGDVLTVESVSNGAMGNQYNMNAYLFCNYGASSTYERNTVAANKP